MTTRRGVIIGVLCFVLGAGAYGVAERVNQHLARMARIAGAPPLDRPLYDRRTSQFSTLQSEVRTALLGDSRFHEAEWHELLGRGDVANRGIAGDTTSGLLARLPQSVPAGVSVCIIQIGFNDLLQGGSIDDAERNYREIVERLLGRKPPPQVILSSVILAGETNADLNKRVAELNKRLYQLASQRQLRWIDLNATLCEHGALEPKWTNDGVHLNGEAYRLIAGQLQVD